MKKILLTTAACAVAFTAVPAMAEVELGVGGYASMYGAYVNHDEAAGNEEGNNFDIVRDTQVFVSGENTLDNGLTVGASIAADTDNTSGDNFAVDTSYLYFSGNWGKLDVGAVDGSSYILQVAAPSADNNIDGVEQFINPVNYTVLTSSSTGFTSGVAVDYNNGLTDVHDKISYYTPVISGFQIGASVTPDNDAADDLEGVGRDDQDGTYGRGYDLAARYEGEFQSVNVKAGAGMAKSTLEDPATVAAGVATDDRTEWNAGLNLGFGPIGIGAVYKEDDFGDVRNAANNGVISEEEVFVVGADYKVGAYKFGASYYDADNTLGYEGLETTRYVGGVSYEFGPGMNLNGSVGRVSHDHGSVDVFNSLADDEVDATFVTVGTVVNF